MLKRKREKFARVSMNLTKNTTRDRETSDSDVDSYVSIRGNLAILTCVDETCESRSRSSACEHFPIGNCESLIHTSGL